MDDNKCDTLRPEMELRSAINTWRDEMMAGASLKTTNLQRNYPARVFRHYQDQGTPVSNDDDDHQCPAPPHLYIRLRIKPMMEFYMDRIPLYTRLSFILKTTILLLGVSASVLAHYEMLTWVTTVTAAVAVTTSWTEFNDAPHKVERYSSAVGALKSLLEWWESLEAVHKASKESISELVRQGEKIIVREQSSWASTATGKDLPNAGIDEAEEGKPLALGEGPSRRVLPAGVSPR